MSKRESIAVVSAGLVPAVGSYGRGRADRSEKMTAQPAPTRPPSEELVTWTDGMCESATALESLRTDSAAGLKEIRNLDEDGPSAERLAVSSIARTPRAVEDVARDLENFDRSGVPAADDRLLGCSAPG